MSWPDYLPSLDQYYINTVDTITVNGLFLDAWFCHEELTLYITQQFMCTAVAYCIKKLGENSKPLSSYSTFGEVVP